MVWELDFLALHHGTAFPIVLTRRDQATNRSFFTNAYFHISGQNVKIRKLGGYFWRRNVDF